MAFEVDPKEHYQILADISKLKEDAKEGKVTLREIFERLEEVEQKARINELDHREFITIKSLQPVYESMRKLENSIVVMTPQQAKDAGNSLVQLLGKNPNYMLWLIMGVVVVAMIAMGYSFSEIRQVLEKIQ